MKLFSDQQKEQFARMTPAQKREHIWTYYRAHILLAVILAAIAVSSLHRIVTAKEPVLYTAFVNVSVSEELGAALSEDFLISRGYDTGKQEIYFYEDLRISANPQPEEYEYAYTSSLKIMATIETGDLDLLVMNREAYDMCSGSGYLLDLTELFSPEDPRVAPYLTSNLVLLEDNALEFDLGEAEEYIAVTETVPNALDLSGLPLFQSSGLSGQVYLGVIATSPRLETCADYIAYLTE